MITYFTVPPQGYIGLHISLSHTTWLHNVTHFTIPPQDYIFHYPNTTTIRVTYFTIPPQVYIFQYPTTGLHISISHRTAGSAASVSGWFSKTQATLTPLSSSPTLPLPYAVASAKPLHVAPL